ncbi:MAG: LegC family aminotransferase [Methyloversatilis sp.]|uniref:LegC family aminotransferase n=1 Tax=Methyloversatilis sp. TaxID=2569862 RepID=UPI002734C7F6|nr:LegC family aminotransferase [Methyloversatilis sp.]MDP3871343.1 LegC family aminotransferase [Methyloversatilis sp.]
MISLHEPEFHGNEWTYVKECIDTAWVSSVGKYVDQFETSLAALTGARFAVAVVNGTAAQHVGLLLARVMPGDEVIVPALSFVATANAVSHCGAVPHFVDSCMDTLGMDPVALQEHLEATTERSSGQLRNVRTGRRIAAIVPMHTFGHPVDMPELMDVAARFGLPIVEDAAESLGSTLHGRHTGTFGLLGAMSFNGNKIITTGGGGAILTDDPVLASHAKHLTTTAKKPHRWEFFHDEIAFNYRLPNLNAALGCAQLERLPDLLRRKRLLAERYREAFSLASGIRFVGEPDGACSNYWLNAIRLERPDINARDALLAASNDAGFQCRPAWTLLHRLPMYSSCPRAELPVSEALEASLINVPSSARLAGPDA